MHHTSKDVSAGCACTALRKASRAVTRLYDEALENTGMSIVQFSILRNLSREGAQPLMRLADLLVMERTTLYRALDPLERQGWVSLVAAGPRAKEAALTRAGRQALARATGAWSAAQRRLLQALGHADWSSLESGLARLVATTQALDA